MQFNPDELMGLVGTIWETMLGLAIRPETAAAFGNRPRSMAACIHITGAWNGALLLDCPVEVARRAAAAMFHARPDQVTVTDQQDAIAELVNMIGGNLKALLPETCHLSLPAVVEGGDYSARVPGSAVTCRVPFACGGHAVALSVLEKAPPPGGAAAASGPETSAPPASPSRCAPESSPKEFP